MLNIGAIGQVDSYKVGHINQYPDGLEKVFSNLTPRSTRHADLYPTFKDVPHVMVFGVDIAIKAYMVDHWKKSFFDKPEDEVVEEYREMIEDLLGYPFDVSHVRQLHRLGYLPVVITALPEGTLCPIGVPFMFIENINKKFGWLTNYIETGLSAILWPMVTNATRCLAMKMMMNDFAQETGVPDWFVDFQAHDFSMRGMFGLEAAALSGAAHLSVFKGTDNLAGKKLIKDVYGVWKGNSVNATEHSVMTIYGEEGEKDVIERLLRKFPSGIMSMVLDGFNYFHNIDVTLPSLKDVIEARDGQLVVRPDSGNPRDILLGSLPISSISETIVLYQKHQFEEVAYNTDDFIRCKYLDKDLGKIRYVALVPNKTQGFEFEPTLEEMGTFEILEKHFGSTVNEKGYRVLNEKIGVIYGDSITPSLAKEILTGLKSLGFSTQIVLGLGSYFFQGVTRDTFGMAIKATRATINGEEIPMQKDPATGNGDKKSLKGNIVVQYNEDGMLIARDNIQNVFLDGNQCETLVKFASGNVYNMRPFEEIETKVDYYLNNSDYGYIIKPKN